MIHAESENVKETDNNNGVFYNDKIWTMVLITTTDQQLHHLGHHDLGLAPYFGEVFPRKTSL